MTTEELGADRGSLFLTTLSLESYIHVWRKGI